MKTQIFVKKTIDLEDELGVNVGIVSGYLNNKHTHEYQVFNLKQPVENVGLIGVDNGDKFAISLKPNFFGRFAIAAYLDGVNVSQKNGITNINQIEESERDDYFSHKGKFISDYLHESASYLSRFSQKNEENRLFTFTTAFNTGINEILISDFSLLNRIEVYFWKETEEHGIFFSQREFQRTKVGAGEATNIKYKNVTGLYNPIYLGKAMFVHLNSGNLKHLGQTKISTTTSENFNFKDPMDLVPKT